MKFSIRFPWSTEPFFVFEFMRWGVEYSLPWKRNLWRIYLVLNEHIHCLTIKGPWDKRGRV